MMIFGVFQTIFGLILAITTPLLELTTLTTDSGFIGLLITFLQLLFSLIVLILFFTPLIWLPIGEIIVLKNELNTRWYRVLGWVVLGLVIISIIIANIDSLSAEIDILSSMINVE